MATPVDSAPSLSPADVKLLKTNSNSSSRVKITHSGSIVKVQLLENSEEIL